jgi:hypothetical protein
MGVDYFRVSRVAKIARFSLARWTLILRALVAATPAEDRGATRDKSAS